MNNRQQLEFEYFVVQQEESVHKTNMITTKNQCPWWEQLQDGVSCNKLQAGLISLLRSKNDSAGDIPRVRKMKFHKLLLCLR